MELGTMHTPLICFACACTLTAALGGCGYTVQTKSGKAWLAASPPETIANNDMDQAVRKVAAVEPTLRFPARIGIARLGAGGLMAPSAEEIDVWAEMSKQLGRSYGEFVPVSPLIAEMLEPDLPASSMYSPARRGLDEIRLAAARQHIDAVLIYEVDATADSERTPLSLADWTVLGAFFLPLHQTKACGVAQAMLIDVRNGYPYGTVQSIAEDDFQRTPLLRETLTESELRDTMRIAAVQKLGHEAEDMLRDLKNRLASLHS
jgi:hypothetical protein